MIQEPATDEMYEDLVELAARHSPEDDFAGLATLASNEPGEGAAELLCMHALGKITLTHDQVSMLWLIGFTEHYPPEQLVPDSVLARALPERRTRPPMPVIFPLRGWGNDPGDGVPGKREFPARWAAEGASHYVFSVAEDSDGVARQPDGSYRRWGIRDGVDLRVIIRDGVIVAAYPLAGDGVVTNPIDDLRRPLVERIRRLIDEAQPDMETRALIEELVDVGAWDQALRQLKALGHADPELLRLAGV